jgi:folate-dependent phosphoribosylglycinamide formyltransferase PurN
MKLKVGIQIDNMTIPKYYLEILQLIIKNQSKFYPPIILNQQVSHSKNSILKNFVNRSLLFLINKIESFKINDKHYADLENVDSSLKVINIVPIISKSGYIYRYDEKTLNKIHDEKFDLVLRFGSGILKGKILNLFKFGFISIHHGDNREYRGTPAGFWEVFNASQSTGFIIQKLNEDLDGGDILFRGNIATARSWIQNRERITIKSMTFLWKLICNLQQNQYLPDAEKNFLYDKKLFQSPSNQNLLAYMYKIYTPILLEKIRLYLGIIQPRKWSVSYIKNTNSSLALNKAQTIKNPHNRFLADPFVITVNGETICFVEDYCLSKNKGRISAIKLLDNRNQFLDVVIEEDFHLSFPYIFEHKKNIYMIPESAQNQDIRLYKCTNFPYSWQLEKVLIKDIRAADTTVFRKDKKWYMLTNIDSSSLNDRSSELHLFYSDMLISDDWQPCPSNPVIFDSSKARNAGLFFVKNKIFRANQVQGAGHYGKSIEVNEITDVSTELYREKLQYSIEPKFFSNIDSAHHIHMNNEYIVIDHS